MQVFSHSGYMTVGYGSAFHPCPPGAQADRAALVRPRWFRAGERKDGGTTGWLSFLSEVEVACAAPRGPSFLPPSCLPTSFSFSLPFFFHVNFR